MSVSIKVAIASIAIITILTSINTRYGKQSYQYYFQADATGYYSYLPALFIYEDLSFGFQKDILTNYPATNAYVNYHEDKAINKYYVGTAICQLPFFLIAHAITKITDLAQDGYSKYYALSLNWAAISFLILGLWAFAKTLELLEFSDRTIVIALLALTFGTNLFYYVYCEPGMSHVYSFAMIALLCFLTLKATKNVSIKTLVSLSICIGLCLLIRPINAIVLLFIPFLLGISNQAIPKLSLKQLCLSASLIVAILTIQLFIYKIQTGDFFVFSYKTEGFNFYKPALIKSLFSFKKGLLIYTPILVFTFLGIASIHKRSNRAAMLYMTALFIFLYITSSWHQWYYGGSFGLRPFIDIYAIMFLPIAFWLREKKGNIRKISLGFMLCSLVLCQIQTYQYRYHIIHWSEMNFETYKQVFLKFP